MTAYTLTDIFEAKLSALEPLTLEAELELIARAQLGVSEAYEELLLQYAHGLRGLAKAEYARAGGTVDAEETRANVLLAFAEAVAVCDGTNRVSAKLKVAAFDVAEEHHLIGGLSVPARTRKRYLQALRDAGPDGDPEAKALELGMAPETFLAVRDAIGTRSIEGEHARRMGRLTEDHATDYFTSPVHASPVGTERGYATIDDKALVAQAFAAVDALTEGVIRDAYGFTDYDPIPDAEIGHRRGYSRSKVQRIRTEGISTMRVALGVDEDEEAGE